MLSRTVSMAFIAGLAAAASGCGELHCSGAAVEGAKKLDRAYLAELYAYAASGQCKGTCRPALLSRLSGLGNRPPVFEVIPNGRAQIKLSVCMDEGAILRFKNIGTQSGALYIAWSVDDLKWDEELLWSVAQTNASTGTD